MLLMLLGPEFRFQVEKPFLSLATVLSLALEIVMDSVIIQNMGVLRVLDENEPLVKNSFKCWQAVKKIKFLFSVDSPQLQCKCTVLSIYIFLM